MLRKHFFFPPQLLICDKYATNDKKAKDSAGQGRYKYDESHWEILVPMSKTT